MTLPAKDIPTAQPLRVETVNSFEHFQRLEDHWQRLFNTAVVNYPMLAHDWLDAWWRAFSAEREPFVVLVWEVDRLVGAAPLLRERQKILFGRSRVLKPWVNTWVDRYTFLVAGSPTGLMGGSPADVVDTLVGHLVSLTPTWDVLELPRLDESCPVTVWIRDSFAARKLPVATDEDLQSPYLKLPPSWEDLLAQLSPSFRQNLKRKRRKVEQSHNISMAILTGEDCLEPLIEISLESWQHEAGTSIASQPSILAFFRHVISAHAARGTLRCALLWVGDEPAAFELNLVQGPTLHNFKLGFKKKFSKISTGLVLKSFVFQSLLEEKIVTEYDFMGVAEPYKLNWTKSVRAHHRLIVYAGRRHLRLQFALLYQLKPYLREHHPRVFGLIKKAVKTLGGTSGTQAS